MPILRKTCLIIALLCFADTAVAVDIVKSPVVIEDQLELEEKGRISYDQDPARDNEKEFELSVGYGMTSWWKTKVDAVLEQKRTSTFHDKTTKWENAFNLNGNDVQNKTVFGIYQDVTVGDPTDGSDYVTLGLLAQRSLDKFGNIGNIYIKRDYGVTAQHGVAFQYRWQSKYTILPYLEPGFELIGDTQRRDAFHDQSLMIGPSVFGNFTLTDTTKLYYELGYLLGATPATRDGTLKWKLKYAVQF